MLDALRALRLPRARSERGASSVEYGLVLTGIAALIAGIIFVFGDNVLDLFGDTCQTMVSTQGSGDCN